MPASALPAKLLQMIRGRYSQGIQFTSSIEHQQLPAGLLGDVMGYSPRHFALKYLFSLLAFEGLDHGDSIARGVINVKRYYRQALLA